MEVHSVRVFMRRKREHQDRSCSEGGRSIGEKGAVNLNTANGGNTIIIV